MSVCISQPMDQDHLLKIEQVAKHLNVAPNTVRSAIESGHLLAYLLPGKGRGTYRIPESSVERYLSEHVFRPADPPKPTQSVRGLPFKHLVLDDVDR